MKKSTFKHTHLALLIALLALSTPSKADISDTSLDALLNLSLKELASINVIAQKRTENLQRVPISIEVISGAQIQRNGLIRSEDLAHIAPSLSYSKRIDLSKSSMKIRGIGTLVFGEGVESSVATYIDGVLMSSAGAGFDDLDDVKQVEVLNGPQSTLFGKNASAGLMHIITNKPNADKFESSVELMSSNDQEHKLRFIVTGPINKQFAYRLSAYARRYDGNVENIYNGHQLNGYDTEGMRAKLQWSPSDNIDLLFSADYSKQETDFGVRVLRQDSSSILLDPAAIGQVGTPATAGQITGISGGKYNSRVNLDRDPAIDSKNDGLSLEINWHIQDHTLTSISAYRNWTLDGDRDNDQTQLPFSLSQTEERDTHWFTQELRDASPLAKHFDYVAGLFFYHSRTNDLSGDNRTFSNDPYAVEFNLADNTITRDNSAIFGQLNMHPNEALTLFAGLRYLYDKVEVDLSRQANTRNNPFLGDGEIISIRDVAAVSNSDNTKKMTGKAGAQYQFDTDTMGYLSYSRGFKAGAFNTSFKFNTEAFLNEEPVDPEQSDTWELGLRTLWLDGGLRLNATLFYTDFEGLHQTVRDLENNRNIIGSIPQVISKGLEIDFVALLSKRWTVEGGVTYLDASYKDFTNANCYANQSEIEGCISSVGGKAQDLSGESLSGAPEWKGFVGARYAWQFKNHDNHTQLNLRAQSEANLDAAGNPDALQGGYGIVDFHIGIDSSDGRYGAKLFVMNVFDKHYINGVSINGDAGGDLLLQLIPRDFDRYSGGSFTLNL